jgi:hypothetical protein
VKKLLVFIFIISVAAACFAGELEDKKSELQRVKKYILTLDAKIIAARDAKQINRISRLKDLKRRQLDRADRVKAEIERLAKGETVAPKPEPEPEPVIVAKPKEKAERGWQADVGYGGGALLLGGGYRFPFRNLDLVAGFEYGIGNEYSIMGANLGAFFPMGPNFVQVGLSIVDYSETVTGILGVSGNVEKGGKLGFGVSAGRPVYVPRIGKVAVKVGYNTALGLTAGVIYKF